MTDCLIPAYEEKVRLRRENEALKRRVAELEAQIAAAEKSRARHWNPIYNTDPVQRACGELPEGVEIEILLENGSGTVYLVDNNWGERTILDNEDEFDWTIHKAIDAALTQPAEKQERL